MTFDQLICLIGTLWHEATESGNADLVRFLEVEHRIAFNEYQSRQELNRLVGVE